MPAPGTIKLNKEAYKIIAHRAIDAEMRPNELLDAIILHSDWENDLPALVKRVNEARAAPENKSECLPEKKLENSPEKAQSVRTLEKSMNTVRERPEKQKSLESLGAYSQKEECENADPTR